MRGLVEKDLRLTLARKQTGLIFIAVALIMGLSVNGFFAIGYLTMLGTIVALGTISYDEYDNGFAFLMTLPIDRNTYVREKYLFCLILAATAWCLGAALHTVGSLVRQDGAALEELPMLTAFIPASFLAVAVMIPVQLKYGSEKSRLVLFLIYGAVAFLTLGARQFPGGSNTLSALTRTLDGMPSYAVLLALTALCALVSYASYLWSKRIMGKKEF